MKKLGNVKPFALFIIVLLGIFFPLSIYSQNRSIDLNEELNFAKQLYLSGEYDRAIAKLNNLFQFTKNIESNKKKEILAEINLLKGFCYWKQGNKSSASNLLKLALKYEPELEARESRYDSDAIKYFEEIKKAAKTEAEIPPEMDSNKTGRGKEYKNVESEFVPSKLDKTLDLGTIIEINQNILIRIIKEGATLRLKQDDSSVIIRNLPLGALLEATKIANGWIEIVFPQDKDGNIVLGYVRSSFVEIESIIKVIK